MVFKERTAMKRIFICYSHKDEKCKDELVKHLKVLVSPEELDIWQDRRIAAGAVWYKEIQAALNSADAAILLISADFLTSPFILEKEIPPLFRRRAEQKMHIYPLIAQDCPWQEIDWLAPIQARPKDGKPLDKFKKPERNTVLSAFAREIKCLLQPAARTGTSPVKVDKPVEKNAVKVSIEKLPVTGKDVFGREKEVEILERAWAGAHTHIVWLTAWGGVGKTALVNHWLNLLAEKDYGGAARVYAWSFYSQGAAEGKQASADEFFQETLAWFNDSDPKAGYRSIRPAAWWSSSAGKRPCSSSTASSPCNTRPGRAAALPAASKTPASRCC
jgi:hypothetical protein